METSPSRESDLPFAAGDLAVHPAHGVGRVKGVEMRDVGGQPTAFYVLDITDGGTRVLVALKAARSVLRHVMGRAEAEAVLVILCAQEVAVDAQPWSRRHRIYSEMLRSGQPSEIAKVLRDMQRLRVDKDLSFSERRLLDQARQLLFHELSLATGATRAQIEDKMKSSLAS